ncbi:hypothetical protein Bbelb_073900 [Branchiostoma belcheri]|nr:hypothetical protein Bbelb_073900 [Branchiostoma belcheri]
MPGIPMLEQESLKYLPKHLNTDILGLISRERETRPETFIGLKKHIWRVNASERVRGKDLCHGAELLILSESSRTRCPPPARPKIVEAKPSIDHSFSRQKARWAPVEGFVIISVETLVRVRNAKRLAGGVRWDKVHAGWRRSLEGLIAPAPRWEDRGFLPPIRMVSMDYVPELPAAALQLLHTGVIW